MRRWIFGLGALIGTTALVMACSVGTDCDFGLCAGPQVPGDDGGDSGGDGPVIPPGCDLTKSPEESAGCVDDGVGVFVSPSGKADAAGTKLAPLSSITAAISKAVSSRLPRIYICDGKYDEPIKLTSAVSIYGGFDCSWTHTGVKPKIAPAKGPAIEVNSVADEIVIQEIDATGSSDSSVKGSSAIGALVVRSKVGFRAVAVNASAGQEGATGTTSSNYSDAAAIGNKATGSVGGADKTCTCLDLTSSRGGHGAEGNGSMISNGAAIPVIANSNSGGSGADTCTPGGIGANGEPDGVGDPIVSPGSLVETGWDVSKLGDVGKNGHPAQGGGGGGAKTDFTAAGGGGGCGGCGGGGGAAGGNGGGSIGIVSLESAIRIDGASVVSAAGGKGGTGGGGQVGQDGAGGGGSAACPGGAGGAGAGGSGGAGGTGGDSIAIAWTGGSEPVVTATELKPGAAGDPGGAGAPGLGNGKPGMTGKPGNIGKSIAIYVQQ